MMSNYYNKTRGEYYSKIDEAARTGKSELFIDYAVKGFRDGLFDVLKTIHGNLIDVIWLNYLNSVFDIR